MSASEFAFQLRRFQQVFAAYRCATGNFLNIGERPLHSVFPWHARSIAQDESTAITWCAETIFRGLPLLALRAA